MALGITSFAGEGHTDRREDRSTKTRYTGNIAPSFVTMFYCQTYSIPEAHMQAGEYQRDRRTRTHMVTHSMTNVHHHVNIWHSRCSITSKFAVVRSRREF